MRERTCVTPISKKNEILENLRSRRSQSSSIKTERTIHDICNPDKYAQTRTIHECDAMKNIRPENSISILLKEYKGKMFWAWIFANNDLHTIGYCPYCGTKLDKMKRGTEVPEGSDHPQDEKN